MVPARLGTHTPAKKPPVQASFHGPREEPQPRDRACAKNALVFLGRIFLGKIKRHLVRVLLLLEYPTALGAEGR